MSKTKNQKPKPKKKKTNYTCKNTPVFKENKDKMTRVDGCIKYLPNLTSKKPKISNKKIQIKFTRKTFFVSMFSLEVVNEFVEFKRSPRKRRIFHLQVSMGERWRGDLLAAWAVPSSMAAPVGGPPFHF